MMRTDSDRVQDQIQALGDMYYDLKWWVYATSNESSLSKLSKSRVLPVGRAVVLPNRLVGSDRLQL
jgi:hypothetical protein